MLALLIKALLIQAFSIPSGSMMHTLEIKDRVLVNKLIYDVRGIHRGEIVVFNGIDDWAPEAPVTERHGRVRHSAPPGRHVLRPDVGRQGLHQAGHRPAR